MFDEAKKQIMVTFKCIHLVNPIESNSIPMWFDDLYDVFTLNGLDMLILRIFML